MHTCSHLIHTVQFVCVHRSKSNTQTHTPAHAHTHTRTSPTLDMSVHLAAPVFCFFLYFSPQWFDDSFKSCLSTGGADLSSFVWGCCGETRTGGATPTLSSPTAILCTG